MGFGKAMKKRVGKRNFHEKGVGVQDQAPPAPFQTQMFYYCTLLKHTCINS